MCASRRSQPDREATRAPFLLFRFVTTCARRVPDRGEGRTWDTASSILLGSAVLSVTIYVCLDNAKIPGTTVRV